MKKLFKKIKNLYLENTSEHQRIGIRIAVVLIAPILLTTFLPQTLLSKLNHLYQRSDKLEEGQAESFHANFYQEILIEGKIKKTGIILVNPADTITIVLNRIGGRRALLSNYTLRKEVTNQLASKFISHQKLLFDERIVQKKYPIRKKQYGKKRKPRY